MPDRRTASDTERRFVRSEDPSLTPEANRLLTEELQEVVGAEEVEVPAGTPRRSDEAHAVHSPLVTTLLSNRPILIVTLLAAVVVGAIVSSPPAGTRPSCSPSACTRWERCSSPPARS